MVFHWSLSDSKSPQVSRTRFRILAVLSNAVVWIVSTRPPTSKSSRPLVVVPNAPVTIGTIVTFMFHSFFNSLARSRYLSFFSLSFRFILWFAWTAKSTYYYYYYYFSPLGWDWRIPRLHLCRRVRLPEYDTKLYQMMERKFFFFFFKYSYSFKKRWVDKKTWVWWWCQNRI